MLGMLRRGRGVLHRSLARLVTKPETTTSTSCRWEGIGYSWYSSSRHLEADSSRFESQRVLLNRQTARPVLFDEFESDDELDFSLEEKPTGQELYENKIHNLLREEDDEIEDSDDEDPEPAMKVGKQLLQLGKVPYRRIEYLPDWVMERKHEISEYRTPRQIRRCVKNWMLKPDRNTQQEYAFKNVGWAESTSTNKTTDVGNGAKVPEMKGSKDKSSPFVYGPEETVAYCNFFFPSRFAITQRIFRELKTLMPKYQPRRILDLGCGVGTVGAAAVDVWGNSVPGVEKYVGIDQSSAMLDAARIMTTRMGIMQNTDDDETGYKVKQYSPNSSTRGKRTRPVVSMRHKLGSPIDVVLLSKTGECVKRIQKGGDRERYDMAAAAYTLSELQTDATKRAAVQVLYEALDVNGILVLIDNGSPIGSHNVRSGRQFLLDMFGASVESGDQCVKSDSMKMFGKTAEVNYVLPPPTNPDTNKPYRYDDFTVKVLAPCTHDRACPLKPGAWCSFKQKTQSSMIRKASEEKYSYVILQKQLKKPPAEVKHVHNQCNDWTLDPLDVDPGRDPTPLSTMQRFLDAEKEDDVNNLVEDLLDEVDWDDYNPPLFREEYGRIIRSPLKKKGHIILDTCQSDGNLTRSVISKSEVWQVPTLYTALRKLRWGGLVPVLPLDQQQLRGPLAESHKALISEEMQSSGDGSNTGYSPSSFVGQSPMSRRTAHMDPPLQKLTPPPVKVGKRSAIWKEGEGLKKNDRNRNYQGRGGLVMDEERHLEKKDELPSLDYESLQALSDPNFQQEDEAASWDDNDSDGDDEEFNDEIDHNDASQKMDKESSTIDDAFARLRAGKLPKPEDEGKERFFADDYGDAVERENDVAPENSEISDLDLWNELQKYNSLDSIKDTGGMGSIDWDKVFADLQKDGAFDDIDLDSVEKLESKMKDANFDHIQSDDDVMKNMINGNNLNMDDFENMLQPEELNKNEEILNNETPLPKPKVKVRRRPVEDMDMSDDEEEIWQKGLKAGRPGADVVINTSEDGRMRKADIQGLKKFDKLAKSRLDDIREANPFSSSVDDNQPRRGRRRRPLSSRPSRRNFSTSTFVR